jgi:tryptophan-rich sensory protein
MNFYLLWLFIPIIGWFISGRIGKPDEWYNNLNKPKYNPPKIIFPIAWTILYILMGISYYYGLYKMPFNYNIIPIIHLLLNFSYTPMFFYFKQKLGSAILTILIFIFGLLTIIQFGLMDKTLISVYLMIPYLIWLIFANYLSWSIYKLNN